MAGRGKLSEEEMNALQECANEAFYQRCIPLMTLFGTGTYLAIRSGKLNPHYKWGAAPKVIVACFIAHFVGTISYNENCKQKLMDIPDSKLGELLRKQDAGIGFSSEEMRVLQECNRESFYQRCLPLSTLFGISTYMGVKSGYLKTSQRFGAVPKVIGAVVAGYLLGKVSYQGKCAEKLMALPDSKIGALLRNRRFGGSERNALTLEDRELEKVLTDIPETEKFSDISNRSMDLDVDRPLSSGLEDFRPNLDDIRLDDGGLLPSDNTKTTSYEELRRRNREDYEQKRTKPYRGVVTPEEVPTGLSPSDQPLSDAPLPRPSNMYGDIWEK